MPDNFSPDDRDLNSSMNDFEAALTAKRFDLTLPKLGVILAVIDGSNQGDMTIGIAAELAQRNAATLHVAHVYVGPPDTGRDAARDAYAARLADAGVTAVVAPRQQQDRPPYTQISGLARSIGVDLVVVPAPFLEDYAELGSDSIGANLDKLMTQSRPLLVVREPRENPVNSLKPLLLALSVHVEENPRAAAWALRIIGGSGTIHVVAVVDDDVIEAATDLIGEHDAADLDLDRLAGFNRPDTAGLIAAMHRVSQERGLGCKVSVYQGDLVSRVIELAESEQRLIVTGCEPDPASSSYRSVQALIRRSNDPVLVV